MGISERVWKHRFVNQMAELFEKGGMDPDAAAALSYHHADAHYPERDASRDPEEESYSIYETMADHAVERYGDETSEVLPVGWSQWP